MFQRKSLKKIKKGRKWIVRVGASVAVLFFTINLISAYVGWSLTHPKRSSIRENPQNYGLNYQDVAFKSLRGDVTLTGWLMPSRNKKAVVILAHGYRGNRSSSKPMLPLAKALNEKNISVLTFDFRNSGQSQGELTSIGHLERYDLLGAIEYVKKEGYTHVGLAGFSMGGATSLLISSEKSVHAIMADSAFADLEPYLESNLSAWSNLPNFPFTSIVLWQIPWMLGMSPTLVRPIEEIKKNQDTPVFLIHAKGDMDIPYQNSVQLFKAANPALAKIWLTEGTKHVGSYEEHGEEYIQKATEFFEANLK